MLIKVFLIMKVLKMIKFFLQTGPGEARRFVHPVVGSSLQSEASEEQQPLAQQPSPQSGQFWWVFTACSCSATLSAARNPKHLSVFGDAALKWSRVHSVPKRWLSGSQQEAGGEERLRMFACQNANISAKHTCWPWETLEKDPWNASLLLHPCCRMSSVPTAFSGFSCVKGYSVCGHMVPVDIVARVVWTQSIFY